MLPLIMDHMQHMPLMRMHITTTWLNMEAF
jgi:hypothetical protein